MDYIYLNCLKDLMLKAHNLCYWKLSKDYFVLECNESRMYFLHHILEISNSFEALKNHFSQKRIPILLTDVLNHSWIAVGEYTDKSEINGYHLLGPIFMKEISDSYFINRCNQFSIPRDLIHYLKEEKSNIPIILYNQCTDYAVMLHYCITGETLLRSQIDLQRYGIDIVEKSVEADKSWHGSWPSEQRIFNSIKDGIRLDIYKDFSGKVGVFSTGNPLRQAQIELIHLIILGSRAAILAGVEPESAYRLADYYIQQVESCKHSNDVYSIAPRLYDECIARVQQCKINQQFSFLVYRCTEYISSKIYTKIDLQKMADYIGYNKYYMSKVFLKEYKMTISDYIKQQKIEVAKDFLKTTNLSVANISEKLCFSSPSYFSSVFRKITGITPNEYRNLNESE